MIKLTVISGEIPSPEKLDTKLVPGFPTKRHEFSQPRGNRDVFVVFEGEEKKPFWRMFGRGVTFVTDKRTFAQMTELAKDPTNGIVHTVHDSRGDEFQLYYMGAYRNLIAPPE